MKKRYILSTIIIVCIFTCIAVFQFNNRKYTVYADTVYFTGLSSSLSESELEAQTNTNSQNDVSNNTPMITFITHGLGGNASHWSNILVESGTVEAPTYKREFAYEPNSLIEQLRNKAGDADVYWASFDNDTNFQLVVCPIVTVFSEPFTKAFVFSHFFKYLLAVNVVI